MTLEHFQESLNILESILIMEFGSILNYLMQLILIKYLTPFLFEKKNEYKDTGFNTTTMLSKI